MLRSPLRSPLNAVVKDVIGHPGNRLPFSKFISDLLSKSGRVAAYYGESWDEILAYNAAQVAAGTPENCVAFEDSEGTIPLVAPLGSGKGCGLLKDRSLGLARGPELVTNGDFSAGSTGWAVTGADATHIVTFSGGQMRYQSGTTSPQLLVVQPNLFVVGKVYEVTFVVSQWVSGAIKFDSFFPGTVVVPTGIGTYRFVVQAGLIGLNITRSTGNVDLTLDSISIRELKGNHRIQTSATARGEMSRRVNRLISTETLATQSITTVATSSILSFSGAGSITLSGTATGTYAAGTHSITTTAGTLTLTVSGTVTQADCRYSADANIGKPYQWVIDPNNYDEESFPAFLRRQTDDWSKAHINPNGATKVLVLTGVQKMSDAPPAVTLESSQNSGANNGCILLLAPNSPGTVSFRANGTVAPLSSTLTGIYPLARTVIAGRGSISPPLSQSVVNGVEGPYVNLDQGSGTYSEQDFYFGSRAGTSLFANDREYSPPLIIFMQPGDPGLTSAEIARLTRQFNKSIKAF